MKSKLFRLFIVVLLSVTLESCKKQLTNVLNNTATIFVKCKNSSSDAAKINHAIENSNPGDEIVFEGKCLINQTIKLLSNRTYRGDNRTGTVLKQANGANLKAVLASAGYLDNITSTDEGVTIRSFTINGNRANNSDTTSGIILRAWQSTITDLHITDMSGSGIKLTNLSTNGTPLKNTTQVNGSIKGNFITNSGTYGVYIQDTGNTSTDWFLTDNWIGGVGKDGIHMENAAGWFVERNHIYGVTGNAIFANRMFGTSISDNYIESFGNTSKTGTYYGVYATVQGNTGNIISENRISLLGGEKEGNSYRFIGIVRVNYGSGVINVNGNAIRGAAKGKAKGIGLYLNGGSHPLKVLSSGNLISNVSKKIEVGQNVTLIKTKTETTEAKKINELLNRRRNSMDSE
jgi:hypothetical protein